MWEWFSVIHDIPIGKHFRNQAVSGWKLFQTYEVAILSQWCHIMASSQEPINSAAFPQLDQANNKENIKASGPLLG